MPTLRARFRLNPGRKGVALGKLSLQSGNIEAFLRSLARDLGIDPAKNLWIADEFKNSSAIYRTEHQALVDAEAAALFNAAIEALLDGGDRHKLPEFVSTETVAKFASMRTCLDDDEPIGVGVYDLDTGRAKPFHYVDRLKLEAIGKSVETESRYFGAVMGSTYEWNKGADRPYIIIRELNSDELVRCNYDDGDYDKVAKLFARKNAVVIIEGSIHLNLITNKTEVVRATGFDFAPEFSDEDFEKFFGAVPGLSGELTSEELIRRGRGG